MNTEINNIVLTSSISETISILQNGVAGACCNTIDRATGLILDLKVNNEVSADDIISVISDLRIVSSMIRSLTPEEEKGGAQCYQNDEEPDKRDELEKQQAERQKAIANFIGQNYSPIGTTSQKCYKTNAELVYELSNIVDVAPMALAKQLADAGYHVEYLAGQPYWVMYERA